MNEIRARVDEIVKDPATAEGLKPWYRQLCKRPCFHDEYLQSYNVPTNHLIDTDGKGVERIDEAGIWANGRRSTKFICEMSAEACTISPRSSPMRGIWTSSP